MNNYLTHSGTSIKKEMGIKMISKKKVWQLTLFIHHLEGRIQ